MSDKSLIGVCPPNSKNAEMSVIGAILQDDVAAVHAFGDLIADDFYYFEHRELFDAMCEMSKKKQPIDVMTVSDVLSKRGTIEGIGGSAYLLQCCRYVPTTANTDAYIGIVKDKAMLRNVIAKCREAEQQCYTQELDTDEIIEGLRTGLRGIELSEGELVSLAEVLTRTYDYIDRRNKREIVSLQSGINSFDHFTGGLMPGNLVIVGARPSVGKSVFGMDIALNVCKTKSVLVVSREMCDLEYGLRILSREARLPGATLKTGAIGDQQWEPLIDAMNTLTSGKLKFDFSSSTIEKITAVSKREYDKNGLDLVVVDYLQLVDTLLKSKNRYVDVGVVSRGLKDLASQLKIPVVAMAQVGRDAEKRCPTKADLRESGNIEQDADIIVFLHEPADADDPDILPKDLESFRNIVDSGRRFLIAKVDKQRMGTKGTFGIDFDPEHMMLRCIDSRPALERSA